jgi:Malectin domain
MQYHKKANSRIFDVFVEGVLVADNLDIYAVAPGNNVSYVITHSTFITDGAVTIDLVRNKDNPQINGIEVFDDGAPIPAPTVAPQVLPPNSAPVPPFEDIVINCGGTLYNSTKQEIDVIRI